MRSVPTPRSPSAATTGTSLCQHPRRLDRPHVHDAALFVDDESSVKIARRAGVARNQLKRLADFPLRRVLYDTVLLGEEERDVDVGETLDLRQAELVPGTLHAHVDDGNAGLRAQ